MKQYRGIAFLLLLIAGGILVIFALNIEHPINWSIAYVIIVLLLTSNLILTDINKMNDKEIKRLKEELIEQKKISSDMTMQAMAWEERAQIYKRGLAE